MDKKTIVVVGAGQGLGNHVAKRFGEGGFRVVLIARNAASLERYRQELADEGIETYAFVADAAQPDTLTAALQQAKQLLGTPDVLFYNVGITTPDNPSEMNAAALMRHYQVDVASAYHAIQHTIADGDFAKKHGAILLTGGGLALQPYAGYLPLSMDKAALRAMAFALYDALKPQGIFIGTVTVCGTIGGSDFFAPSRIAEAYWQLYSERKECEVVYADAK